MSCEKNGYRYDHLYFKCFQLAVLFNYNILRVTFWVRLLATPNFSISKRNEPVISYWKYVLWLKEK